MAHTTKLILSIYIATAAAYADDIQLQGDSAVYNRQSKTITLDTNAIAKNTQGILRSDSIKYDQTTQITTATGNAYFTTTNTNRPIILQSQNLIYNPKNNVLMLNKNARAENNAAVIQSDNMQYNQNMDIIQTQGHTVFTSKISPLVAQGKNALYNGMQQTLVLDKNAQAENDQAILKSDRLQYDQKQEVITTENTIFVSKSDNITLTGNHAIYDRKKQSLVLDKNAQAENDQAILKSDRLQYDQKQEVIETTENTIFVSKSDNITLTGNHAIYDRKKQFITLSKGASAKNGNGILTSDTIVYTQSENIMNASGGVQYTTTLQDNMILTGDMATYDDNIRQLTIRNNTVAKGIHGEIQSNQIIYNESLDLVQAEGNVSYTDPTGDVSTMDTLRSNIAFDTISGTNLQRNLQNNVQISAQTFQTYANGNIQAEKATYTSCRVPEGENSPTWLMRADKVTLDVENQNIAFTNSRMELLGIPLPYFGSNLEQPTPDAVKKDGWLVPDTGTTNVLGLFVQGHYYKSLTDNSDILISPIYTTRKGQGMEFLYRNNNDTRKTILRHNVSFIREDDTGGEIQGHWFASYVKNTHTGWQYRLNHQNVTEKSYLKTYTLLNKATKDTLRTGATATKITPSSTLEIDSASYRDIRQNDRPVTTLFPSIQYERTFQSPAGTSNVNITSIARSIQKKGTLKSHTISTTVTYSRPFVTQQGMLVKTDIIGRADAYKFGYFKEFTVNGKDHTNGRLNRFTPMASMVVSYPLSIRPQNSRPALNRHIILEPIAGIFISKFYENPDGLPNNDSVDFELDESTLFANNRYAGVDKIDTGSRISYGSRLKIWQDDTYVQAFLGQNITQGDNNIASDFIGNLYANWDNVNIYANFELDSHSFRTRKLESNVAYTRDTYKIDMGYTKIEPRKNSQLDPLAQTKFGIAYKINNRWHIRTEHSYEFEESKKGLVRQSVGFEYNTSCGCFGADIEYKQDYSKSRSAPEKSLFVQFKFREIGNIQRQF